MKYKLTMLLMLMMLVFTAPVSVIAQVDEPIEPEARYAKTLQLSRDALMVAETQIQVWSTTEILLADAEVAAEAGDFGLATSLAEEAGLQVELALATAEREKSAWRNRVPK